MGLQPSFRDLPVQLRNLQEALEGLRTTVREDHPLDPRGTVLIDLFGDAADDLLGWLHASLSAAVAARQAAEHFNDPDRARRALTAAHEHVNRIAQHFSVDLLVYERIAELVQFGEERGGEWHAWANSVKEALECCGQALFEANQVLFRCWQELAAQVAAPGVALRATTIGEPLVSG